jgi:hypothetical protein
MPTQDREWICHLQSSEESSLAPDRQWLRISGGGRR